MIIHGKGLVCSNSCSNHHRLFMAIENQDLPQEWHCLSVRDITISLKIHYIPDYQFQNH